MSTKIPTTIVGSHGKHLSVYLRDHLKKEHNVRAHIFAAELNNKSTDWKVTRAQTVICINKEAHKTISNDFDLSQKQVICLDITDAPDGQTAKRLTGDGWVEYQQTHVYPAIEKQISKHIKNLTQTTA